MAYPFKPVEHQVYRNTFLKDVRVAVEFRKVEEKDADKAKLQRFFDQFHGAGIESSDFLAKGGINVFSNDQNVGLSFGMNYAEVKLSTPAYTSFDAAMPFWNMLTARQELLYTLLAQYIDLWSSSSLQGIARVSSDSALASFVTSLKNRYSCVA